MRSEGFSHRSAVIYLDEGGTSSVAKSLWLREIAKSGLIVFGMDFTGSEPVRMIANILKGISYLDLRRDIVDWIFCWARGERGMWGLISAILETRVTSLVLEDVPPKIPFKEGVLETDQLCQLFAPKSLAILGATNVTAFNGTLAAYEELGETTALRIEGECREELKPAIVSWIRERRGRS